MAAVSKANVKVFAQGVKDFMTYLGLGDWEITLSQSDIYGCTDGAIAAVACDIDNCIASFEIAPEWPDTESQDRDNLRRTALHEVLHVLLFKYARLAAERFTTLQQLADTEHDIIRRLVMLYTEVKGKHK